MKKRIFAYDVLRIFAALNVVAIHVCDEYMQRSAVSSIDFAIANLLDCFTRFSVPTFVMISGAIFLDPDKKLDEKRLWTKNIIRLIVAYLVWGYIYYAYQSFYLWHFDFIHQSVSRTLLGIFYASNHFWFLGMIGGIYVLLPVVKAWTLKASKENIEYFVMVFFVFQLVRNTGEILLSSSLVSAFSKFITIPEVTGYLGYFVLGHYLASYDLPAKLRHALYIMLPVDIVINYLVSWKMTADCGSYSAGIYDSFGVFTCLEAIAIFVFVLRRLRNKEIKPLVSHIICNISNDAFGVYLIHVLILNYMIGQGMLERLRPVAIWQVPIIVVVFSISALFAGILRRIPYVGKYIC